MSRSHSRGFTLLEMLVMLVIIAITISFVTLSVGSGSKPRQLEAEVERLYGTIRLAREEAILLGKPLGLRFVEDIQDDQVRFIYDWAVYERGQWKKLAGHSVLQEHVMEEGIAIELNLDGYEANFFGTKKSDDKKAGDARKRRLAQYQPDVFFLQSGELAPAFSVELTVSGLEDRFELSGNPLGQLRQSRFDEKGERSDLDRGQR